MWYFTRIQVTYKIVNTKFRATQSNGNFRFLILTLALAMSLYVHILLTQCPSVSTGMYTPVANNTQSFLVL